MLARFVITGLCVEDTRTHVLCNLLSHRIMFHANNLSWLRGVTVSPEHCNSGCLQILYYERMYLIFVAQKWQNFTQLFCTKMTNSFIVLSCFNARMQNTGMDKMIFTTDDNWMQAHLTNANSRTIKCSIISNGRPTNIEVTFTYMLSAPE